MNWVFRFRGSEARILVEGSQEGFPDLIEVPQLPLQRRFFLLFRNDVWNQIKEWAEAECINFKNLQILQGLPAGWQLASIESVQSDAGIRLKMPALSLPERAHIRFQGGIRLARGNTYFVFAPPTIKIESSDENEEVFCRERRLVAGGDGFTYQLPTDLTPETRITVELRRQNEIINRRSLYLSGDFEWRRRNTGPSYDKWGHQMPEEERAQTLGFGVLVHDNDFEVTRFKSSVLLTPGLERHSARGRGCRIFLLGRLRELNPDVPAEKLVSVAAGQIIA